MLEHYPLLSLIDSPADLRGLGVVHLGRVAEEVRRFLIESVSQTGGHLAAGLGVVELTVALHYVFDTPHDRLVWDIGHQAYPHKILTGRKKQMSGLRQAGGLSGFLRRQESEFDAFGAGHSSTSISAALGMAAAARLQAQARKVVAVIGDGALAAGMAFEAMNHAGDLDLDLLLVLNDNEMSISPNVGGLHNYLARLLSGRVYRSVREGGKQALEAMPSVRDWVRRWTEHTKGMVMPGTLFEELGLTYIGPIDGHDLSTLVDTLRNMRRMTGPRLLHVVTRKGKGYEPAEQDPCVFHGVSPFNPDTGRSRSNHGGGVTYTQVFSDWVCDMADLDHRLAAITPAMCEGSGLVEFAQRFPQRYYDVGIAEQHALTFAAGLACEGAKPVVAIYSTFLQRGYDQLIHDICLQNLDVTLAIDRAGLVGADGPTHAGAFDLSFLRCVPNLVVMAPADEQECRRMLTSAYQYPGPAAVRYPRGQGPGVTVGMALDPIPMGQAQVRRRGQRVAILGFGSQVAAAEEAGSDLDATVVNMRFVKPLDETLLSELATSHELLVTVEENVGAGGAGAAVSECLARHALWVDVLHLALPDRFVEHGPVNVLLSQCGLDAKGIERCIRARLLEVEQGHQQVSL